MNKYRMLTKIVRNMQLKKNEKKHDLNYNEAEALRYITKYEGCISNDLVEYLSVDKALITRILKKLLQLDYIKLKDGVDRRTKPLYATSKALKLKLDTEAFETKYYEQLFQNISNEEQESFFSTLEKIYLESKRIRKANNGKKL